MFGIQECVGVCGCVCVVQTEPGPGSHSKEFRKNSSQPSNAVRLSIEVIMQSRQDAGLAALRRSSGVDLAHGLETLAGATCIARQ